MAYLAIARKYRPSTFDEIVGQDHVTRTLRNAIARGRIHHAFLFTGARGVGKTTAARALARALNCEQGPTATPCGTCTSCVEVTAGTSPDLIEIDGASNNSVEDVRDLREKVRYAPTLGRWKIYLIDEVHMLSRGAFNALLKTLEEPPAHVVFIFATTEPNRIPDTILSRVQRFDFKRIAAPAVAERLRGIADQEGVVISDAALRMIARAGGGSMRDAESLLDQVISFSEGDVADDEVAENLGLIDRSLVYGFVQGLVSGSPELCLDAIERVYDFGHELPVFTSEVLEVLRHATFLRLSPSTRKHVDLPAEDLAQLEQMVADVVPDLLGRLFSAMVDVHDQVARSQRPRILLEMAVARLSQTRPVQPVSVLLDRLEQLERRLRHGGGAPTRRAPTARDPSGGGGSGSAGSGRGGSGGPGRTGPGRGPVRGASPSTSARTRSASSRRPQPAPTAPRAAAPATKPAPPQPAPSTGTPWERFSAQVRASGPPVAHLAAGVPRLREGVLQIALPNGRLEAEGRRAMRRPEVAEALCRCYPEGTTIDVVKRAEGADNPFENDDMLREARRDPAVQRIAETLGATVTAVVSLRDGES